MSVNNRLRWLLVVVAAVALLSIAAFDDQGAETPTERAQELSERFACPECDGQSVAESNAAVAVNIRDFITIAVNQGATDEEIRNTLIENYGSDVLLNPPADGFSALIWILPVVVAVGGAAMVVTSIRRDQGADHEATDEDRALVAEARRQQS